MKKQQLHFCEIMLRDDGFLEIVADEGIEVNDDMIQEIENAFKTLVDSPTGLLVNRIHQYSLTHNAMRAISQLNIVKAIAILVHSDLSLQVAQFQKIYLNNMAVFATEREAIKWLKEKSE